MKITPRHKQILIKPDEKKSYVSENGITAGQAEEKEVKSIGEVIAIGYEISDVHIGDRVIYGTFAGDFIKVGESEDDYDFVIVHDDDVLAIIEENK